MRRTLRLTLLGLLASALLAALAAAWLVATPAGARAAAAMASPWLPAGLELDGISGTIVGELGVARLSWRGDGASVELVGIVADVRLTRLARREIVVDALSADALTVVAGTRAGGEPGLRLTIAAIALDAVRYDLGAAEVRAASVALDSVDLALARDPDAPDAGGGEPFRFASPLAVTIEAFSLGSATVAVDTVRQRLADLAGGVSLTGSSLALRSFGAGVVIDERMTLEAAVDGSLELAEPFVVGADADWTLRVGERTFAGSGRADGPLGALRVRHELRTPYAIESVGDVNLFGGPSFELTNRWRSLRVPIDAGRALVSDDATLVAAGRLGAYALSLDSRVSLAPVEDARVVAEARGDLASITVTRVSAEAGAARVALDGEFTLARDAVTWDGAVDAAGLDIAWLLPGRRGYLDLRARTDGRYPFGGMPVVAAGIDDSTLRFDGLELDASGGLAFDGEALSLDGLQLSSGPNRVRLQGRLAERLDVHADVAAPQIAALHAKARGAIAGRLHVTGAPEWPVVAGDLQGEALGWGDASLAQFSFRATPDAPDAAAAAAVTLRELRWRGALAERTVARISGPAGAHSIELDVENRGAVFGARLDGGIAGGEWSGELSAARLRFGEQRWTLREAVPLLLSRERQRLSTACLVQDATQRVCAELAADAVAGTIDSAVDVDGLPLEPVAAFLAPQVEASGRLAARARLASADGRIDGDFDAGFAAARLRLRDQDPEDAALLHVGISGQIVDSALNASGAVAVADSGTASLEVRVDDVTRTDSTLAARLRTQLDDLGFLSLFVPATISGGTLDGEFRAGGTAAQPVIDGELRVAGMSANVDYSGALFTDIGLSVTPRQSGMLQFSGRAASRDGPVRFSGTTLMDASRHWPTLIRLEGESVELVRLPDWEVSASPTLDIELTTRSVVVRGLVEIPRARIELDALPEAAEAPSPDAVVHRVGAGNEAAVQRFRYDVELDVVAGDEFRLSGFGLDSRLEGRLNLSGTESTPFRGIGELRLADGSFTAYGQTLAIERGTIGFTGPLDNPLLDFRATRRAGEVTAGIAMSGTANEPRSTVFADPPMSEAAALSYLLTGRPLEQAQQADGNRLAGAAVALGLSQAGSIVGEIGATLGLDQLTISGSADDGRVLAGKWLSEDLYLQYGFGIFDRIGSVLVRYRLTDRLTFESESGAEQSLDLVYSVGRER